jgi:hypothetical protein
MGQMFDDHGAPLNEEGAKVMAQVAGNDQFAVMRTLASVLMSRRDLAIASGLTFDGKRDLSKALGYKAALTIADYRTRYRRGGLAARVVDVEPDDTWVDGIELIEQEDRSTTTAFEDTWRELNDRLNIMSVFHRADKLSGIGRYAVVLIGAPGRLEDPLPNRLKPEQILYLTPFAEDDAKIDPSDLVTDTANPRFGRPEFYRLARLSPSDNIERRVHWTRLHHIADPLDDPLFGPPRLERVWNLFDDLDKVTGGGAEAFWQRAHQGYHINIDKDTKITDSKVWDELKEEMDEFLNGMRRAFRTKGTDVNTLGADVADFLNPAKAIIEQIAGARGIPQRILLGSERGELASTQDRDTWQARMLKRFIRYAVPVIIKPFVDVLINTGALPQPAQYSAFWPNPSLLSDKDRVTMAAQLANVNKNYGEPVVTVADIRERVLGWPATDPTLEEMKREKEERAKEMQERMRQGGGADPNAPAPEDRPFAAALGQHLPPDARPRGVIVPVKNYRRAA